MSTNELDSADILGWASSGTVDRVGQYARSGRKHKRLTDEELTALWVAAIERLADDFANPRLRLGEDDLRSEMTLRKMEPPYEHAAFKRYAGKVSKLLDVIEQNEPAQYLEMIGETEADVSEFKSGRDRGPN